VTRDEQRGVITEAFVDALWTYRAKRSAENALSQSETSHEGSVALGKALQALSLGLRLGLFTQAEYQAFMARIGQEDPQAVRK
jgi:putative flippase GtrA